MRERKQRPLGPSRRVAVSILADTVSIEVMCGDLYEANVLYDDLIERLQKGETISLSVEPKVPARGAPG